MEPAAPVSEVTEATQTHSRRTSWSALALTSLLTSLLALVLALWFRSSPEHALSPTDLQTLDAILNGLLQFESQALERRAKLSVPVRVAVGFGSCKDVFAQAVPLLTQYGASPPAEKELVHHASIGSKEELEEGLAYFFRHGAAAERYVSDKEVFKQIVAIAESLPGVRHVLGGNAPVMANRMAKEGAEVLLAARLSPALKNDLHPGVKTVEFEEDEEVEDDIHLILEYVKNEQWGHLTAPRANRYIVHSDADNPWITSLEPLQNAIGEFSPHLLVIGGLQMLDNFPGFAEGERRERLFELASFLASVPSTTLTHFEMASFAEEVLLSDLVDSVLYYSDSLGMNEQELPNLFSILNHGSVTLISDAYPRVACVLDQMRSVFSMLRHTPSTDGKRPLTRLHVHTLAYQAIMTVKSSVWQDSRGAAAKASLTANRHICGAADIDASKAKILMDDSFSSSREEGSTRIPFDPKQPVSCWEEDGGTIEICIAPVLVCLDVKQTAGGGDNISSAGLVYNV